MNIFEIDLNSIPSLARFINAIWELRIKNGGVVQHEHITLHPNDMKTYWFIFSHLSKDLKDRYSVIMHPSGLPNSLLGFYINFKIDGIESGEALLWTIDKNEKESMCMLRKESQN